ncbi:MAG: hypothetical protein ACTHQM_26565 [Thermoanaerobaculia bacterium]
MHPQHRHAIASIVERLTPEAWAPAFTGLLLHVDHHRSEVYDYAQRLIQAYAFRSDPFSLETLDLSYETLQPGADYDAPANAREGYAVIPRRLQWNGVLALDDPSGFRRAMNWGENEPLIEDLRDALRSYLRDREVAVHRQKNGALVCAVHPYADCSLLPAILYGLRDVLGVELKLELVDWVDLPAALKESRIDIAYSSSDLINTDVYEFRMIRTRPSRMAALCKISNNGERKAETYIERVANFNGYYTAQANGGADEIVRIQIGDQTRTYSSQAHASTADNEAKHILALATGTLPSTCVIATLQGFLWAAEAGLLATTDGKDVRLGTLVVGEVIKKESAGTLGFAVRLKKNKAFAQQLAAALQSLLRAVERKCAAIMKEAGEKDSVAARQLFAHLKAPVLAAQRVDAGILARISPDLILRATLPAGDLFEREIDYRPAWWTQLATDDVKAAAPTALHNALPA